MHCVGVSTYVGCFSYRHNISVPVQCHMFIVLSRTDDSCNLFVGI